LKRKDLKPKKKAYNGSVELDKVEVFYSLGATINLGDFESAKVSFGLTLSGSYKNLDKIIEKVKVKVEEEIGKEVEKLRKNALCQK